jgi:hypothetical protein
MFFGSAKIQAGGYGFRTGLNLARRLVLRPLGRVGFDRDEVTVW